MVKDREEGNTDYLQFLSHYKSYEIELNPSKGVEINVDDFGEYNERRPEMSSHLSQGTAFAISPTPIFDPATESLHSSIDFEDLEQEININGQTFRLAPLKKATKL